MLNVQEQATQHVAVPIAVPVAPPQPLQMGQRADPQGTPQQLTLADGRMLYVNSSGWACCELPSTHTNNDAVRRTWYLGSDGLLTLDDGRQLYANPQGRVGVALPETHTNNDAARRTWHLGSDGVLTLNDGRQLHCTIDTILPSEKKKKKSKAKIAAGLLYTVAEGEGTNTDASRRRWTCTIPQMGAPVRGVLADEHMMKAHAKRKQDTHSVLDAETAWALTYMSSPLIKKRTSYWENTGSSLCGWFRRPNTWDIIDGDGGTGRALFVAQEVPSVNYLTRCCCKPYHSLRVDFKLVNTATREWYSRKEIAQMPTVPLTIGHERSSGFPRKPRPRPLPAPSRPRPRPRHSGVHDRAERNRQQAVPRLLRVQRRVLRWRADAHRATAGTGRAGWGCRTQAGDDQPGDLFRLR